ncbi:MAG: L-threonylcarbamoyladenylate synthase [bacterium]
MDWNEPNLIKVLKENGIVVMPTDTLYGIVGNALDEEVVSRIYATRKRNPEKPCIILIGDISELDKFSVSVSENQKEKIKEYWFTPSGAEGARPVSIILDCPDEKFAYLHRGTKTLAFRLPQNENLRNLLKQTGPLVAPSANLEGLPPAKNIEEAKKYFGVFVDLYIDWGEINGQASRVIRLHKDGSVDVLR